MKEKSSTKRSKNYRDRLKLIGNEEKLNEHIQKQNNSWKNYHENMIFGEKAAEYKKKRSEATKRWKLKKNEKKSNLKYGDDSPDVGFKSQKGLKKAVKKIQNSLPKTKQKAVEAIKVVAQDLDLEVKIRKTETKTTNGRKNFQQTSDLVKVFYESDDISRQMPGKKDTITVKLDGGIKEVLQKRSMLMTVDRAYEQFKETNPEIDVSRSKFYQLKPPNILLISEIPKDVCLCCYCENFNFLYMALRPFFLLEDIGNLKDFLGKFSCSDDYECAASLCYNCQDYESMLDQCLIPFSDNKSIKWFKWVKDGNFYQKELLRGMVLSDAVEAFAKTFKYYKQHVYLIKAQYRAISTLKKETDHTKAVIQMDYSENFTTFSQKEIQAAHFNRRQISLFTAIATVQNSVNISFAIVNNDIRHSKFQVLYYMKLLIENVRHLYPNLAHVDFVTDGCASQFKNKFILTDLLHIKSDFGINATWHFMPTSHGKSAADGIGGILKRQVSNRIKTGLFEVHSAADFVDCARSFVKKINIILGTKNEMNSELSFLGNRWDKVNVIPGTQSLHFFEPLESNLLLGAVSSDRDGATIFRIF
ncbi:unnamed protein product [Chironomus riparius]|uniref:Uncharacterized protein n=1 Tax=Chironomus riparius TaxID=315576 RepID=A0A9N9RNF3_9DIPT|nr:unnamed protein product [Chironomus riparius]